MEKTDFFMLKSTFLRCFFFFFVIKWFLDIKCLNKEEQRQPTFFCICSVEYRVSFY